jgi:hypothetical protein
MVDDDDDDDDDERGAIGGMIGRRGRSTQKKPVPEPHYPLQIPNYLHQAQTQAPRFGTPETNRMSYGTA